MVEINKLTEYIETTLNASLTALNEPLLSNVAFKIFTDTGMLQEDLRTQFSNTVTEYINGVVSAGTSDKYVLSNGLEFTSLPLRLELLIRLEDDEFNGGEIEVDIEENELQTLSQAFIGNQEKLATIRKVLDNAFSGQQVFNTEQDGKLYMTTLIAQVSQGENRGSESIVGYSYSYFMNFYFNFVENGLNSQNGKFYLDGVEIPYTNSTITKIKNADQNLFSDANGEIVGVPTFSQKTFTFDIPALNNSGPSSVFLEELLKTKDLNAFHVLKVTLGTEEVAMLVNITEVDGSLSGVQNVGLKVVFGLAPTVYSLLSPEGWNVYKATSTVTVSVNVAITFESGKLKEIVSSDIGGQTVFANDYILTKTDLSETQGLTPL